MARNLNPDDIFTFTCRCCGSCCRDDREIVLNPQDVFSISRHLGIGSREFVEKYCDCNPCAGYGPFPLLTLLTPGGACIFLDGSLCSLHTVRPACCRNYPAGTLFDSEGNPRHILMDPAPGCLGADSDAEYTVASWSAAAGIDALTPGIKLLAEAFSFASLHPRDMQLGEELYKILCDFDPLPAPGENETEPAPRVLSPSSAMGILSVRLKSLTSRY